MEVINNNDIKV